MQTRVTRIRRPVKREHAERYLRYTLLSFAVSVVVTRTFLFLTGFPQVGGGTLHIAHLLWGGLLLFAASLLPLLLANRWVYPTGAVLSGVGVGLFIDEVGKFITRSNDYFYPAAAPIIYAFFLLVVLLYLRITRVRIADPRAELYSVLDDLAEVLDRDLTAQEQAELQARLQRVAANKDHPELVQLANDLLDFLNRADLEIVPYTPNFLERRIDQARKYAARTIKRTQLRIALIAGLTVLGLLDFYSLIPLVLVALSPALFERMIREMVVAGQVSSITGASFFSARLALQGAVGVLLVVAAALLALGRERQGLLCGYLGLLLALTTVDLLIFYFDQFSTIAFAIIQFALLWGVLYYRQHYVRDRRPDRQLEA